MDHLCVTVSPQDFRLSSDGVDSEANVMSWGKDLVASGTGGDHDVGLVNEGVVAFPLGARVSICVIGCVGPVRRR